MKTLTNVKEFVKLYSNEKGFIDAKNNSNIAMRFYISSYGYRATRELAKEVIDVS